MEYEIKRMNFKDLVGLYKETLESDGKVEKYLSELLYKEIKLRNPYWDK